MKKFSEQKQFSWAVSPCIVGRDELNRILYRAYLWRLTEKIKDGRYLGRNEYFGTDKKFVGFCFETEDIALHKLKQKWIEQKSI